MKYLKQLMLLLTLTFIGEVLNHVLPFPIPAGVYGLLILLFCLQTKLIRLESIGAAGGFLLDIMPVMFIPSSVGLILILGDIKNQAGSLLMITLVSTVVVMGVTGLVAQALVRFSKQRREKKRAEVEE